MKKKYAIYQGQTRSLDGPVLPVDNRAFHFGDGLFETIRIANGKPCFLENHWSRAKDGMKTLCIECEGDDFFTQLEKQLTHLLQKNEITEGGRARLTIFRNSNGFYKPDQNSASYVMEAYPMEGNTFSLNKEGLIVDIYPEIKKPINKLSVFKTLSCQTYIQASLYCQKNELDDCLIVNENGNIIESSNSNLFLVSNGVFYTPNLEEGCVGGTMRMQVINMALDMGIKVYECALTPQNLLVADEIFLTNAIQGIQWVGSYRMKRYFHKSSESMVRRLNEVLAN